MDHIFPAELGKRFYLYIMVTLSHLTMLYIFLRSRDALTLESVIQGYIYWWFTNVFIHDLDHLSCFCSQLPCSNNCNGHFADEDLRDVTNDAHNLKAKDNIKGGDDVKGSHFVRPPVFQKGVLRTNCIDCLDRTNVAQYVYGLVALGHQLHALGYIDVPSINLDSSLADDLMKNYEAMGDTLALQYGGSAAHNKVDITCFPEMLHVGCTCPVQKQSPFSFSIFSSYELGDLILIICIWDFMLL